MPELFIPSRDACRLLNLTYPNTRSLHSLGIRSKKDFNERLWSRDDIYAELRRRRLNSHPPSGFLTVADIARKLNRSLAYTYFLLSKSRIKPSYAHIWNGSAYGKTKIYSAAQLRAFLRDMEFKKNSFPPEGWLLMADCASFLNRSPQYLRAYLFPKHKIRIKKLSSSLCLYNEDDIIELRKLLRRRTKKTAIQNQPD